jgi:4-hydroxy-3-polyprenylbenzoate decarboxylase
MHRIVVGISGATGAIYGIRLLQVLHELPDIESHLIVTPAGRATIQLETDWTMAGVEALATRVHRYGDIAAAPSSGSFRVDAMVVLPCSMRTLTGIAYSISDNLLARAADVTLKEGRPLILAPRETPLHLGHLRALLQVAEMGARVVPPMPAFYHRPQTLQEIIDQTVQRICDQLGLELPKDLFRRWEGPAAILAEKASGAEKAALERELAARALGEDTAEIRDD